MLHPGETVKEYLEDKKWTQADLAREARLSTKTISTLCAKKSPITARIAVRFEKVLGRPANFWMALQAAFDIERERRKVK